MSNKALNAKALCAMSGGVDSSVAVALMQEQGFKCAGITLELFKKDINCLKFESIENKNNFPIQTEQCSGTEASVAKKIAFDLGIEHYLLDLTDEFDKYVIRNFAETYEMGETPNPCIECNRNIKFNFLHFEKIQIEFDIYATGHYARITKDPINGRYLLRKAADDKKDQSYVLFCLTQKQLEKTCFPLGEFSKNEVRKIAKSKKLTNASKSESQDICFVPNGDYGNFIERYTGKKYPQGDIINQEGKIIGRHNGIIRYTIGQRRGLGVAANEPVFVIKKSIDNNTITLARDEALLTKTLLAKKINLIACDDILKPMQVMVKTRYLQTAASAIAEQTDKDTIKIVFDAPQRAITPGQAAVMYDGDIVIGGGTITGSGAE